MTTQSSPMVERSTSTRLRQVLAQPWGSFYGWLVLPVVTVVVLGWALPVFHHPAWIMVLGSLYAMKLGRLMGAVEIIEGIQEFAASLPISRRRLLVTRLVAGLTAVTALVTVSTLAIAFNWPQAVWSLFVESGFTQPFGPWPSHHNYFYLLAIACPILTYLTAFGLSLSLRSRQAVDLLAFLAVLAVLAATLGGLAIERWQWGASNGYVATGLLALLAAVMMIVGARTFLRKSAVHTEAGKWAGLWIAIVILLLLAVMAMLYLMMGDSARFDEHPDPRSERTTAAAPAALEAEAILNSAAPPSDPAPSDTQE